ncbi:hypothetical protein JKP88DRAFT_240918 [Tribonema minus]|uniref:Uncharacterized protein n=1 Tax=Tribonema minus TaxID=303371 RepID=A0A835Z3U1_9STRA|nr:hypothetical protein JKP88DRAFT_240918 [Tribonema minus]
MNDIEAASIKVSDFIFRERGKAKTVLHQDWAEAVADCAEKYRSMMDCFLMPIKGDSDTISRPRANGTPSYFAEYNWNSKNFPTLCLCIEAEFRAEDAQYRDLRREIWEGINRDQPSLKAAIDKKGVREQRGSFKRVPRPAWIDVGEPGDGLTEGEAKEFSAIRNAVSEIRNQFWRERQQPGTRNPPKPFTLLPVFDLKPAFVQISHKVVSQIGGKLAAMSAAQAASPPLPQAKDESDDAVKPKRPFSVTTNTRLWWTPVFDFHSGDWVIAPWCERSRLERRHRRQQRPGQQKKRARAARAVLKMRRKTRRFGIHQLRKESWILNDDEYGRRKEGPAPHLIRSISTDGTQCNVTLGHGAIAWLTSAVTRSP